MKNMYLPPEFEPRKRNLLFRDDYENSPGHVELTERLCKSLYYGRNPATERPSLPVTEMCVELFQEAAPRGLGKVDPFFASSVGRKSCISPCSMMLGMIYIDRLKKRNSEYLKTVSSSDLFLISMMVASKYLYDEGVDEEVFNDEWAESATMETDDVNEAEMDFLAAIDWSLFVQPHDFQEMLNNVEKRIATKQGIDRGWFSYMDLLVISEDGTLTQTLQALMLEISKVMVVCSVAYVASVVTLVIAPMTLTLVRTSLPPQSSTQLPINVSNLSASVAGGDSMFENINTSLVDDVEREKLNGNETSVEIVTGDEQDNDSSIVEGASRYNTRITLPGLMTLAFIKDTMDTIFIRMLGKSKDDHEAGSEGTAERSDWSATTMSCTPGVCNENHASSANCRNFSSVEDYENWCLACLNMFTGDMNSKPQMGSGRRSCLGSGSNMDLMDRCHRGFSCSQMPFSPVFPQCCCLRDVNVWLSRLPGRVLYQPFSDVALGFGTTVKPV